MNRKIIGLFTAVFLIAFCFVGVSAASSNGLANGYGIDGTTTNAGSQSNPYAINDLADFKTISSSNWGVDVYYQQTADLILDSNIHIGYVSYSSYFTSTYNGDGYAINGNSQYFVHWALTGSAVLENLNLINILNTGAIGMLSLIQVQGGQNVIVRNLYVDNYVRNNGDCWSGSIGTCETGTATFTNIVVINSNTKYSSSQLVGGSITGGFNNWASSTAITTNNVVISSSVSGASQQSRIGNTGRGSLLNNYASSNCIPSSSSTDQNSNNGATISATEYNSQSWWQNTALFDFSSSGAWEWDLVNQLPKLKHSLQSPTITTVAVTSTTPAEIGSTVSVTATLENTPTTDAGTVTFYTSTTPAVVSSWVSVGSQLISTQSTAGIISHSFTGSSTDGTYYLKAILSDTTQSVTYDSYTDGSITNVFFVLQYADPIPNTPGGPIQPIGIPYTITLTASCSNEITVASYVWQLQTGGNWGNVSTGQQYTPTITTPGNHVYRFLAIGKNGHVIPSTSITVNAGYAPSAVITQPTTGTQIEPGQQLTLEATIGGTAGTYTWDFGNGVSSHGTETGTVDSQSQSITSYVIYNQQKGTRDITLTVSNVYGTTAVYRIYIENGKGTLRPVAVSTVKPVDSSGIYNLINDSKPTSYENQMPNLSAMVTDVTAPMTSIIGEWFYLVLFAVPYIILFLRQKNILIPSILGVLFAAWLLVFLPGAAMKAAIGILILCVAGGIIGLYVKRQS